MPDIKVKTIPNPYAVAVGVDMTKRITQDIRKFSRSKRNFLFVDANVYALHNKTINQIMKQAGGRSLEFVIPPGERSKSHATLKKLYDFLLSQKIARDDLIIAIGGGVTTDLAGYAAATTLRGIRWGAVPTTLLGMVDAAIGGKTGINHEAGKNLIGAFWQPSFVTCDLRFLSTQSDRDFFSGMGEVLKYAGLLGDPMLKDITRYLDDTVNLSQKNILDIVTHSVRCKADIVSRDERESNRRMLLNLGHTFAHGIEKSLGYGKLLHGEAVMIGLLAMCELSVALKPARRERLREYHDLCTSFVSRLPKRAVDAAKALDAMALDKKRSGPLPKFILLDSPGRPLIVDSPPDRHVRDALQRALTHYRAKRKR